MTGLYRREGSPAARVEGCGRFTAPVRTCRRPESRLGWAVAAARDEQAVGGGGNSSAGVLRWHWAARVESVSTGVSVGCSWEG